jgi:limonene 1,2-monooxygenase
MTQRDRQDEALAIIRRLFKGERVTAKSDWFTMNDAALQLLPLQEDMPCVVASQISPSGMTLAGKYGIGIISLGSMSTQGLMALPTQWGFAEDAAKKAGTTVSRSDWRVLLSWHIAETREQAMREAGPGLMRWHNDIMSAPAAAGWSRSPRPRTRSRNRRRECRLHHRHAGRFVKTIKN